MADEKPSVPDLMANLEASLVAANVAKAKLIGDEDWLRERFPDKDWHRHARGVSGHTQMCDGTSSDCASKARL